MKTDGMKVAHSTDPSLVGSNIIGLKDADGTDIALGEVTHPIFNKSVRYAEEYICRSTGQDGIAVRQAFTDWAFGKGARIVLAHNLPLADDQRSLVQREQIMSHNGWKMFSQVWCKAE